MGELSDCDVVKAASTMDYEDYMRYLAENEVNYYDLVFRVSNTKLSFNSVKMLDTIFSFTAICPMSYWFLKSKAGCEIGENYLSVLGLKLYNDYLTVLCEWSDSRFTGFASGYI